MGSGLTNLHIKGGLPGELFAISRNHLPHRRGQAVLPGSARPQASGHRKHMEVLNLNSDQDRFGSSRWTPEIPSRMAALFLSWSCDNAILHFMHLISSDLIC